MKRICIIFLSLVIISVMAIGLANAQSESTVPNDNYLRIHIRADSNDTEDQAVKYEIRDRIVEYLTPVVANCQTKEAAISAISALLSDIERVAQKELSLRGFDYGASAQLTVEYFPTRTYGEYELPAGEYAALVLALGSGSGDNWWCVVYPPLCFSGGENVVYKSKIAEIIRRFYR